MATATTIMSRPQIGIDRLPPRRVANEPREAMNCKSCRKRKIKCNRIRPTCEACRVFNCPCLYDAVPKKRGPKTDVLEALLKRVDGLEKRLETEPKGDDQEACENAGGTPEDAPLHTISSPQTPSHPPVKAASHPQLTSPIEPEVPPPTPPPPRIPPDILLDTYFARIHSKPFYILDENTTRQRIKAHQLPSFLCNAIYAVSARFAPFSGVYHATVQIGEEYASQARREIDFDELSIDTLQALLILSQANHQLGRGEKTFMLLNAAVSMAFALDLHREMPANIKISSAERDARRRLFWSCYLMDRFAATGSKRPSIISDESIVLRLPSWQLHPGGMVLEGDYFPNGSNLQYLNSTGKNCQGGMGMLIGISRILGITNRYLAAGGVKGDSHFPWHSLSNLSKIRQELDIWATETRDVFTTIEALFGQSDSTILVLSKLVYHLIHCLIYRPFLPVDLAELSGPTQHQSWQIEATNLCFLHANAIAELVAIGDTSSIIDWPAFVGYCVCAAATIHIHGAHYPGREGEVYAVSAEFLSREMQQLIELRLIWASVQHQRDTLQKVYGCHSELVRSLASDPMRYAPVFQLEDFFDRYPGQIFDGSEITFLKLSTNLDEDGLATQNIEQRNSMYMTSGIISDQHNYSNPQPPKEAAYQNGHPNKRRRATTSTCIPANINTKRNLALTEQSANPSLVPASATHPQKYSASATYPLLAVVPSSTGPSHCNDSKTTLLHTSIPPLTPPTQDTVFALNPHGLSIPFSPTFNFSPIPPFSLAPSPTAKSPAHETYSITFDPMLNMPTPYDQQHTPGSGSTSGHSQHADAETKDPFLSLLEQLAENDGQGGPSELEFYFGGGAAG